MINMLSALLFIMGTATATPSRSPNACQLLSEHDVARVQGEAFKSVKLTETEAEGLSVSQCFYTLPSFSSSVSIDLMRGKTRAFWTSHFSEARGERDADEDRDRPAAIKTASRSPEAEEEHHPARRIDGIGDAAVWSGNRISGALYVLKNKTIVRVSVGGAGSEEQKIARSKKLATLALGRL
jgi:hypothetical protein